jgi:hypothetical protein
MVLALVALALTVQSGLPKGYPCLQGPCPGYPMPLNPPGYWLLKNPTADVVVDVFGDNLCYFTMKSWPTIKALAQHYAEAKASVSIRFHFLPLPYHHDAYFVAMVDHWAATTAFNGGKVGALLWPFADKIFSQQSLLLQQAINLTEPEVKARIGSIAAEAGIPLEEYTAWTQNGSAYHAVDSFTRTSWKYAVSRGVDATPIFMVNGFQVAESSTANTGTANITSWTGIIDPILEAQEDSDTSMFAV